MSRRRMQEKVDAKATEYAEKMKEVLVIFIVNYYKFKWSKSAG